MKKTTKIFWELACQYNSASVTLWEASPVAKCYYNPCMYLLRHTLELQLKGLILQCSNLDDINLIQIHVSENKNKKITNVHSLDELWLGFKHYIINYPPQHLFAEDEMSKIEKVIKFFDKIDHDSTYYRYPISKSGKRTRMYPAKLSEPLDVSSELGTHPPVIFFDKKITCLIQSGKKEIIKAIEAFDAVEMLFGYFNCL